MFPFLLPDLYVLSGSESMIGPGAASVSVCVEVSRLKAITSTVCVGRMEALRAVIIKEVDN